MSKSKTSNKDNIAAVEKYKRFEDSESGIAKEYGLDPKTLCAWIANYESHGAEAFKRKLDIAQMAPKYVPHRTLH